MAMYDTFDEARMALETARMDTIADHGEALADAAHSDLVHAIADCCSPEVADELMRREGVQRREGAR